MGNGVKGESLVYFSSIADNKSYDEYLSKINGYSSYDYRRDLIQQIYVCSKICNAKFYHYKTGASGVLVGGLICGIMVILSKFIVDYFYCSY